MVVVERAAKWAFGTFAARDFVLFRGEEFLPFGVGFGDFLHGVGGA